MTKILRDVVRFVYQSCRWKENITYRVPGVAYPADRAVQFDLAATYEIHEGRVMEIGSGMDVVTVIRAE